jgi:hypothetical protein
MASVEQIARLQEFGRAVRSGLTPATALSVGPQALGRDKPRGYLTG